MAVARKSLSIRTSVDAEAFWIYGGNKPQDERRPLMLLSLLGCLCSVGKMKKERKEPFLLLP